MKPDELHKHSAELKGRERIESLLALVIASDSFNVMEGYIGVHSSWLTDEEVAQLLKDGYQVRWGWWRSYEYGWLIQFPKGS